MDKYKAKKAGILKFGNCTIKLEPTKKQIWKCDGLPRNATYCLSRVGTTINVDLNTFLEYFEKVGEHD